MNKVYAMLSKWTSVLPQLSYRWIVLVPNNLIASMLWHRFVPLDGTEEINWLPLDWRSLDQGSWSIFVNLQSQQHCVDNMGYDSQLFLLKPAVRYTSATFSVYFKRMSLVFKVIEMQSSTSTRTTFYNPMVQARTLKSAAIRTKSCTATNTLFCHI